MFAVYVADADDEGIDRALFNAGSVFFLPAISYLLFLLALGRLPKVLGGISIQC